MGCPCHTPKPENRKGNIPGESYMVIPDLDVILKGSPYEDVLPNYKKFFEQTKIVTIQDLENCPRYAGTNLCGHSTYEFVAFVRDATIEFYKPVPEEPKAEPKPEPPKPPARKKKVSSKPKPVVEPVAEADSDKDEDAQSSEKE